MAKKKKIVKKKSQAPLKDFDIVAHTVNLSVSYNLKGDYQNNKVLAVYLNRYGLEIGYLLLEDNETLWSMDPVLYEEYLERTSEA